MSTNFPTTYDVMVNPGAGDSLSTTNVAHHGEHGTANDAISALEQKVGVDGATATGTIDYILKNSGSMTPGHRHYQEYRPTGVVTANFTATSAFNLYRLSGLITGILPSAVGNGGTLTFKLVSGTFLVSAIGGATIDGSTTALVNAQYAAITLCDATASAWSVI